MELVKLTRTDDEATRPVSAIFGLRYLEEEEAEIHDVIGCAIPLYESETGGSATGCDDFD